MQSPEPPSEARSPRIGLPWLMGALVGVALACAYGFTLAPTVWAGDSGELATAAWGLGIPHAPGYPTFTLLGFLATHLPIGPDPAWRLNCFTALCALAACLAVYRLMLRRDHTPLVAAVVALGVGVGPTLWAHSVVAEVYTLNVLLLVLFWTSLQRDLDEGKPHLATWVWGGLACTAHQTSLIAVLVGLYCQWQALDPAMRKQLPRLAIMGIIPPLALYLYPLIASQANPILNWGDPDTIDKWIRFVLLPAGSQISTGSVWDHLLYLGDLVFGDLLGGGSGHTSEMGLAPALLAILGVVTALREKSVPAIHRVWALTFVGYVAAFVLFLHPSPASLPKLDPYYLPVWVLGWFLVPVEYHKLLDALTASVKSAHSMPLVRPVLMLVIALTVIVTGVRSALDNNRSGDTLVRDSYTSMLNGCAQGTVLLCNFDDLFPLLYLQRVEGVRTDVVPVVVSLPTTTADEFWGGWLYDELEAAHPDLAIDRTLTTPPQQRLAAYLARVTPANPVSITVTDPEGVLGQSPMLDYPGYDFSALSYEFNPQPLAFRVASRGQTLPLSQLDDVANWYLMDDENTTYERWRERYATSYDQGFLMTRYLVGMTRTANALVRESHGTDEAALALAQELYLSAIQLAPTELGLYRDAIAVAEAARDPERASSIQGNLVDILPTVLNLNDDPAYKLYVAEQLRWADLLIRDGQRDTALAVVQEVLQEDPGNVPARELLDELTKE